eukprot:TRINITY_DN1663_c0_g1_i1.p1 TRINITY_DN1663_c0_g1~~TRINITY_DN1663_c0_g1_i1.p1  ORF type:complete len:354 (+),score=42.66 TRINITY_DN1663_c0_g1_i1:138-1199(+)
MRDFYADARNGGLVHQLFLAAHQDPDEFVLLGGGRSVAIGVLIAVLAAVANGSFAVLAKTRAVHSARVDPYIFNIWASLGVLVTSLLMLVKVKFVWSWWAVLSAIFFVVSLANAFRAVRLVGVSVATGVWAGTAVIVSFLAGWIFDSHGGINHIVVAVVATLIVIGGIVGVAWSGHVGRVGIGQEERLETLLSNEGAGGLELEGAYSSGVYSALIAGVLGGLVMLPMTRAASEAQGMRFVVPFGICVIILAPVVTAIPYLVTAREWPNLHYDVAALPGIAAGIIWNIGNLLSIAAITYLGYPVAYPIYQCGVFVAGIWGMLLYDEVRDDSATKFWGSALAIVVGIALLSYAAA